MMCKAILVGGLLGIGLGYWFRWLEIFGVDAEGFYCDAERVDVVNNVYEPTERVEDVRND